MPEIKPEKVISHLKEKWKGRNCPMCGIGNWNVSDKIFEVREFNGGDLILGGTPIIPVVPVTCSNCGNIIMVNAIISGAVEGEGDG